MIQGDCENVQSWMRRPYVIQALHRRDRLRENVILIQKNVRTLVEDCDLHEFAATFPQLRVGADCLRLAAAVSISVDGIISREPENFAQNPCNAERIRRRGFGRVSIGLAEDECGKRENATMFVTSPRHFAINIDKNGWTTDWRSEPSGILVPLGFSHPSSERLLRIWRQVRERLAVFLRFLL
ncbi:MAG: hypothetical protein ACFB9N_01285 [Geitlerinemataceae cyanobacterium]